MNIRESSNPDPEMFAPTPEAAVQLGKALEAAEKLILPDLYDLNPDEALSGEPEPLDGVALDNNEQ